MKKLSITCIAALAATTLSAPAFAQHIVPPGTSFSAVGGATLNSNICVLTLNANSNATGTGGTITGGTNTGPGICSAITIDSGATYVLTTYHAGPPASADAQLSGLKVRVAGALYCVQGATPINFTITNNAGGTTSQIKLAATIGACTVSANLAAPVTVGP